MKERYRENTYVKLWVEDGVIYEIFKSDIEIDLEAAKAIVEDRLVVSNGETMPLFADTRNVLSMDRKAIKYLNQERGVHLLSAGAFYIDSKFQVYLYNLLMRVKKPPIPAKMFYNKEEALEWLQIFKQMDWENTKN